MAENGGRVHHAPLDRSNKIGQFDAILGLKEELYRTRAQKRWLIIKIMTESVGRVNYRADACTIEDKFVLRYRNKCAFMFLNYIRFYTTSGWW